MVYCPFFGNKADRFSSIPVFFCIFAAAMPRGKACLESDYFDRFLNGELGHFTN